MSNRAVKTLTQREVEEILFDYLNKYCDVPDLTPRTKVSYRILKDGIQVWIDNPVHLLEDKRNE